ncbi:AfsR/SARP family transcriptional regulator [Micromonospora sagamiensis]|uniref:DNA-binding SARP family transcriptional activator n=1 Tax=Micromonospora sagamiensis TaxID=47875 RepID=A0A562WH07_9ACTN|nr:BTAD domain-containing putative transcriptional regulator [Micromonospora sagamiensis]TWJ29462.1 DNA-binding SARP family transcriptional activator [Micromonospora sagamiensis]BCL17510.1 SARP family transcriptional regulator [Micromonospora sagamiensis]
MASYGILGPLEATAAGRRVTPRSPKQRAVLAALLVHANRVTPIDLLLAALWHDDPPDTAVGQVQTLVWRLRGVLGEAITTRPGGYQLSVNPGELDADVFATTAAESAELARAGRLVEASDRYDDALALWRGPVLADVRFPGDPGAVGFHAAVAELTEQRLAVERDRVDVALALGRHVGSIPRLHRMVRDEPLREELRERLMLALHRAGRRAEALAVYRQGRQTMVGELGLEPGENLRRLHRRILDDDPGLHVPGPAPARPVAAPVAQLPMDVADFVGRDDLAAALARRLATTGTPPSDPDARVARPPAAPPIVVVSGVAGSGKTTLAVRVGHLARTHFPDGQLFLDLRGGGGEPLDPAAALGRVLASLGEEPRAVPVGLDDRAALFRARTAGRRLLIVLDNAAGETQLRPLLPAEPGCAVLVTARRRLTALPGAYHVDVGVFSGEQALDLLRHAIGDQRVAAEHVDCVRVAERCGHLPLAIRIAGARLAARPHWPAGRLADQLADERARLDVLRTGDLAVRSSLALSHQELDPVERRLLRLLGALDLPRVPEWTAAALLDLPLPQAQELMERLAEARLVDAEPNAYRLHDLIRAYARELSAGDPADEVDAALGRFVGGWLTLADEAYRRTGGGFRRGTPGTGPRWSRWTTAGRDALLADPVAWFESCRGMLAGTVRRAAAAGLHEPAWNLANTLGRLFELREHLDDWRGTTDAALAACVAAGNDTGLAWLRRSLGELHLNLDRLDDALACFDAALAGFDRLGERRGQALVLRAAGTAHRLGHRDAEAMTALGRAEAITIELGDRRGRAQVLFGLGAAHRTAGRPGPAEAAFRQALGIFRQLDDRFGEAYASTSLALVLAGHGADADALRLLRRALALCRELGYRRGAAICRGHLGDLYLRRGEYERAVVELTRAVDGSRRVGDRIGELIALRRLGEAYLALGRWEAARSALVSCLALGSEHGDGREWKRALSLLGEARAGSAAGRSGPAGADDAVAAAVTVSEMRAG